MATDRPLTDAEAIQERWTSPGSTILETYPPEFILPALRNGGMLPDDAAVVSRAGEDIAALLAENARLRERVEDARPLLREAVGAFANVYNVSVDDTDIAWWVDAWWQNRLPDTEVERLREADRE